MRCELMGPRLSAWVDGELIGVSGWLVGRHVASCAVCAAEVESLRALSLKLSAANPVLTPIAPRNRAYPSAILGLGTATALAGLTLFLLLPRQSSTVAPMAQVKFVKLQEKQLALASPAPNLILNGNLRLPVTRPNVTNMSRPSVYMSNADPASVYHSNPSAPEPPKLPSEAVNDVVVRGAAAPARWATASKPRARRSVRQVRRDRQPEIVRVATARKRVHRARSLSLAAKPDEPVRVALAESGFGTPLETPERESFAPPRPAVAPMARAVTKAPARRAERDSSARETTKKDSKDNEVARRVRAVLVITPTRYENVVLVQPGAMEIDDDRDERRESEGEPPPP
jgi:hypothetical protein